MSRNTRLKELGEVLFTIIGALIRVPTVAIILSEDRFAETRNFDCRKYGQMVFCLLRNK